MRSGSICGYSVIQQIFSCGTTGPFKNSTFWGGRWEGGSCLGKHVELKILKFKKKHILFNSIRVSFSEIRTQTQVNLSVHDSAQTEI